MPGAIFVGLKCPGNFGPVFSSRLPVLVTPIGRLFLLRKILSPKIIQVSPILPKQGDMCPLKINPEGKH